MMDGPPSRTLLVPVTILSHSFSFHVEPLRPFSMKVLPLVHQRFRNKGLIRPGLVLPFVLADRTPARPGLADHISHDEHVPDPPRVYREVML